MNGIEYVLEMATKCYGQNCKKHPTRFSRLLKVNKIKRKVELEVKAG